MSTFLSECDLLAEQLGRRATAQQERMAISNVRAAVVAAGCMVVFFAAAENHPAYQTSPIASVQQAGHENDGLKRRWANCTGADHPALQQPAGCPAIDLATQGAAAPPTHPAAMLGPGAVPSSYHVPAGH